MLYEQKFMKLNKKNKMPSNMRKEKPLLVRELDQKRFALITIPKTG